MKKADIVKEKIIETTIGLIRKNNGMIDNITIRDIAKLSEVGIGLVNYHFGTKENLIEQCVQRIITKVITSFQPQIYENMNAVNRLKTVAKQVADFLMDNPEISKISIIADLSSPKIMDNTMKTVMGFMTTIAVQNEEKQAENKLLSYCMTLILQGVFLRKDTTKDTIGYEINDKEERDKFIDYVINKLFEEGCDENINA